MEISTAAANYARWLQVLHTAGHLTIQALCSEANSLTSFFPLSFLWTLTFTISCESSVHDRVHTQARLHGWRKTRRQDGGAPLFVPPAEGGVPCPSRRQLTFSICFAKSTRLHKNPPERPSSQRCRSLWLHPGMHRYFLCHLRDRQVNNPEVTPRLFTQLALD